MCVARSGCDCDHGIIIYSIWYETVEHSGAAISISVATVAEQSVNSQADTQQVQSIYCDLHNDRPKTAETSAIRVS